MARSVTYDPAIAAWVRHHLVGSAPAVSVLRGGHVPAARAPQKVCFNWPSEERCMNHSATLLWYTALSGLPSLSEPRGTPK